MQQKIPTFYWKEIFAVFITSISSFLYGITYSYNVYSEAGDGHMAVGVESLSGSLSTLTNVLGILMWMYTVNRLGRRSTFLIVYVLYIIGGLALFFCNTFTVFLINRVIVGICNGAACIVTIYLSEVCHKTRRGFSVSFSLVLASSGVLLTTVVQYFISGSQVALISAFIAAIGFCGTLFVPESKYWYVMHDNEEKATQSALWFDGSLTEEDMKQEFDEIKRQISSRESFFSILRRGYHFKRWLISTLLLMGRSGCGRSPLEIFANDYLKSYYMDYDTKRLTMLMSSAEFVVGFFCSFLIGKFNRKGSFYVISAILITSLGTLIVYSVFADRITQFCPWFPLPFIFAYTCGVVSLLFPLLGLIAVETISSSSNKRSSLLCVTYIIANITRTVITAAAPVIWNSSGFASVLAIFLASNIFCLVLVRFFVPETNNKPLHECVAEDR